MKHEVSSYQIEQYSSRDLTMLVVAKLEDNITGEEEAKYLEAKYLLKGPYQEMDIEITKNYEKNRCGVTVNCKLKSSRKDRCLRVGGGVYQGAK